jgi:hypothetical protein
MMKKGVLFYEKTNEEAAGGRCTNDYCDKCVFGYSEIRVCIMGRDTSITDEDVYCDDCVSVITDHLEEHHYPLSN